jgi:hypothetical protein
MIEKRRRLFAAGTAAVAMLLAATGSSQATSESPADWAAVVGANVTGSTLTRIAGAPGTAAGGIATLALSMGDGHVELVAGAPNGRRRIGFSTRDTAVGAAIDFAFELDEAGEVHVLESGRPRGTAVTYAATDRLRIAIELGAIVYRKNGAILFRSDVAPTYPLRVETVLDAPAATLAGVVLAGHLERIAVDAPRFSVASGAYAAAQNVVITVDTPGATLRYTTDGREPIETDAPLAPGATLVANRGLTLKARAWAPGLIPSRVITAVYAIGGDVTPEATDAPAPTATPTATPTRAPSPGAASAPAASAAEPGEPAHPVMNIPGTGSNAEAILAAYTEAQFLEYVPKQAPRHWDYGFGAAIVPGDTSWSWSAASPNEIRSMPSGTVFPNAAYPILYEAVPVLSGKTIQAPYHLAANSSTRKSMPYAHIDFAKRGKLRSDLLQLAAAYVRSGATPETRDDRFARRIAIALDAWADYVPDYFMTAKNSPSYISAAGFTRLTSDIQRCSDHNGLAHEWTDDEILAFDAIYDSRALEQLSVEKGYDVRAHIKSDLFGNIGDFIAQRVPVSVAIATNLSGPFTTLAQVARVINRPDYMEWMAEYLDETLRRKIMRDGTLPEGIGYSVGYINENLDGARQTRDYFLTREPVTPALVTLKAKSVEYVSLLQFGQSQWNALRLPDGRLASFGDTNFNASTPRNRGVSGLLPAYGHVALGAGTGTDAVQLNLNASDDSNHMRSDVTGFVLFANGDEQLGNVRYFNGTPGRNWGEQILSHNAVTIDRVNMTRGTWTVGKSNHRFTSGNITLYEPGLAGLGVVEVDGRRPYESRASRYQRVMVVNTTDLGRPYVVDVFRVTGGRTHDYTFHGAIRFDQTWESSVPLAPDPAQYPMLEGTETWVEPTSSGSTFPYYGYWREVSKGAAPGDFQLTYRDTDAVKKRDVRLWVTDGGMADIYVGKTPTAERVNTEPPNFYKYWRPSLILRRRISSGTQESLFAHVVEPLKNGASSIQSVQRVPLDAAGMDAVALRVTFTDGRVDTVLVNLQNPRIAGAAGGSPTVGTADGRYSLTGRIGVHTRGPAGERGWSVAASDFQFEGAGLGVAAPTFEGAITGFVRKATGATTDAFVTASPLPEGTVLRGRPLSLRYETYRVVNSTTIQNGISELFEIDRVERIGDQTYVHLTRDHQLALGEDGKLREQIAPERTFEGPFTFHIATDLSAVPISSIADVLTPRGQAAAVTFTLRDLGVTLPEALTVTATSSNTNVVAPGGLVLSGGGSDYALDVTPVPDVDGKTAITVTASDGTNATSRRFIVRVGNVNDPPTLSPIADRLIDVNGTTGAIPFTVGDPDTPLAALTVTASSSDPLVVPATNVVIAGSGGSRTVTATAANDASGSADISVVVSDGLNQTTETFTVTVDDPPSMAAIADQTVGANRSSAPIAFTVADRETPADALIVSAATSNATLLPLSGIALGGSGGARTVTITPGANQVGTANVTLQVSDGRRVTSRVFSVTVDGPPEISIVPDRTIDEDTSTGPIAFSVGDKETAAPGITVTATSSNPDLVPDANIVIASAPSPWTNTDLGTPNPAGSGLAGEVFTLRANGNDIWSTADKGHFLYQPIADDGEMIARVTSVQATDPWSKAGVMFRVSTAANSPNIYMLVSAVNGVSFQRRLTAGASSTSTVVAGISAPCWVRLKKEGATFTGYYALDSAGVRGEWVPVGTPVTVAGATWLRGLAATSHRDGTVATSTYDNVSGPADVGGNRTVTVTPQADRSGTAAITLTAGDGVNTTSRTFTVTVAPVNDPPVIAAIEDRSVDEDGTATVPLTIGDADPADVLVVTATSSNPVLLPAETLVLEGEGTSRTLRATPVADQSGTTEVTVTVSDGTSSAATSFTLTVNAVNDAPTVSDIGDQVMLVNGTLTLPLTVADIDDAAADLRVTAASSNTDLVRGAGLVVAGADGHRTLQITPRKLRHGRTTITITVGDGDTTVTETFVLTVNWAPWIGPIGDRRIAPGVTESLLFAVLDFETPPAQLTVTATSSDPSVVPPEGLVLADVFGGVLRALSVTPAPAADGTAVITVTVHDGTHAQSTSFTVTARPRRR